MIFYLRISWEKFSLIETSNKFFFFFLYLDGFVCCPTIKLYLNLLAAVFKLLLLFSPFCVFLFESTGLHALQFAVPFFLLFFFFFKSSIREIRVLLNRIKENRHEKFFCFLRDIFPDLFIHLLRSCTETYFYRRVVTTWWCLTFL